MEEQTPIMSDTHVDDSPISEPNDRLLSGSSSRRYFRIKISDEARNCHLPQDADRNLGKAHR